MFTAVCCSQYKIQKRYLFVVIVVHLRSHFFLCYCIFYNIFSVLYARATFETACQPIKWVEKKLAKPHRKSMIYTSFTSFCVQCSVFSVPYSVNYHFNLSHFFFVSHIETVSSMTTFSSDPTVTEYRMPNANYSNLNSVLFLNKANLSKYENL